MKYVLCPGYITSSSDGDRHWIDALNLARLYQVKMSDCVVWDYRKPGAELNEPPKDWPRLYPDYEYKKPPPLRREKEDK